jgi:hypothetical protein
VINVRDEVAIIKNDYAKIQSDMLKVRVDIKPLQESLASKKKVADALPAQSAELDKKIKGLIDNTRFFKTTMSGLLLGLDTTDKDSWEVMKLVPQGISLTELTNDGTNITMVGQASSESLVLTYAKSLRSSKRFSEVIVLSIKQTTQGDQTITTSVYEFNILLK